MRIGEKVIAQVRTMGIALSSCTPPVRGTPLFEIADDEMEIGIGIHGEPGRERTKLVPANDIVDILLDAVVPDLPFESGDEVALMINGLGGTPISELYLLYGIAHKKLAEKGINVFRSYVNEYCTSLEMAGRIAHAAQGRRRAQGAVAGSGRDLQPGLLRSTGAGGTGLPPLETADGKRKTAANPNPSPRRGGEGLAAEQRVGWRTPKRSSVSLSLPVRLPSPGGGGRGRVPYDRHQWRTASSRVWPRRRATPTPSPSEPASGWCSLRAPCPSTSRDPWSGRAI